MDSLVEDKDWVYYLVDEANANINKISGCHRTRRGANKNWVDQVRLNASGIVEVRHLNEWGGICDEGFTIHEGDVLCRQFGYELGAANIGETFIEQYPRPIHLFDLSCNGEENDVSFQKLD